MRIVALEEHCTFPDLAARVGVEAVLARGLTPGGHRPPAIDRSGAASGHRRWAARRHGMRLALACKCCRWRRPAPTCWTVRRRFRWRATPTTAWPPWWLGSRRAMPPSRTLPTGVPGAAADELERCVRQLGFCGGMVNGTTRELFLDDPQFEPLLARFEALDVPLYLHPAPPPPTVRRVYYDRLPGHSSLLLSIAGWGWHSETAIHVLRLVLSGALDRHRGLKLIIGHMGEGLPAMFARCDQVFADEVRERLTRSISQTLTDQVWVTTSGFFTLPPLMSLLMTFGAPIGSCFRSTIRSAQTHPAVLFSMRCRSGPAGPREDCARQCRPAAAPACPPTSPMMLETMHSRRALGTALCHQAFGGKGRPSGVRMASIWPSRRTWPNRSGGHRNHADWPRPTLGEARRLILYLAGLLQGVFGSRVRRASRSSRVIATTS